MVTSRAVLADPPDVASMAEQMGYDTGQRRDARGRRADRRDGADRGRPARRPGLRGRRPPARAHPRADRRLRRYAGPVAAGHPRQRRRARAASPRPSAWCSASSPAGRCCRWCSGSTASGSARSSCRGSTSLAIAAFGLVSARARLGRARVARQPPGRRGRARRTPRRPPPARVDPGPRPRAARRRHRRVRLRRGHLRQRQRRALDRRLGHRLGARHDPGGAGRGVRRRAALRSAAADSEVRRPRRRAPPHPHGPGRRRRRRDGRRSRRPRHRQRQRRAAERDDVHARRRRWGPATSAGVPRCCAGEEPPDPAEAWARIEAAVHSAAPDVEVDVVRGPDEAYDASGYTTTYVELPASVEEDVWALTYYGPSVVVADDADGLGRRRGDDPIGRRRAGGGPGGRLHQRRRARRTERHHPAGDLARRQRRAGGRLLATRRRPSWCRGTERARACADDDACRPARGRGARPGGGHHAACASPATSTAATETRIKEAVQGAVDGTYALRRARLPAPAEALIVLLVLGALGGVLMLGGTLTATFLALSDARPDLATLSAVGAAPRDPATGRGGVRPRHRLRRRAPRRGGGLHPRHRDLAAADGRASAAPAPGPDGPFLAIPWLLIVSGRGRAAAADRRGRRADRPLPAAAGGPPRLTSVASPAWYLGTIW